MQVYSVHPSMPGHKTGIGSRMGTPTWAEYALLMLRFRLPAQSRNLGFFKDALQPDRNATTATLAGKRRETLLGK